MGVETQYYDINDQAYIKLNKNFDYLNDPNKFTLSLKWLNGKK